MQGQNGGYRHLTLVSLNDGKETALTSGRFVVQEIFKWDHKKNRIFYSANTEENPEILHLYVVKAQAGQFSQCLTCNIKYNGVQQTYFTPMFSDEGDNFVLTVDGPSVPRVDTYFYRVNETGGKWQKMFLLVKYVRVPNFIGVTATVSFDALQLQRARFFTL